MGKWVSRSWARAGLKSAAEAYWAMADSSGNSEQKLNLAALLRAAADDELCSHDERRLEAFIEEDPSLASCIECDQKLREAISRAFCCESGDCAPKSLRDCVADAMR